MKIKKRVWSNESLEGDSTRLIGPIIVLTNNSPNRYTPSALGISGRSNSNIFLTVVYPGPWQRPVRSGGKIRASAWIHCCEKIRKSGSRYQPHFGLLVPGNCGILEKSQTIRNSGQQRQDSTENVSALVRMRNILAVNTNVSHSPRHSPYRAMFETKRTSHVRSATRILRRNLISETSGNVYFHIYLNIGPINPP